MEVQAKILEGRVYFGTFNKGNDIDPKTQRSGLNFFRFNLIGWLLHKLGFAHKVHYTEGKRHGVVYLNSKSFEAWKERHKDDVDLNQKDLNQALSQKDFEKAIQIIYENFTNHRKVNDQDKITPIPPHDNQKNIPLQKPLERVQEEVNGAGKPIEVKQEPVLPQDKNRQIPAIAFGKKEWAELGLEVEDKIIYENFTNHRKVNDQDKITPIPPHDNQKNIPLQKPLERVQEEVNGAGKPIEVKQEPVLPQDKNRQIPAIAFGKKEWAELGLEVEDKIIYENFTNHRKVNDQDKITPIPPHDNQKNIPLQKPLERVQEEVNGAGKPIEVKQEPVLPQDKNRQIPAIAFGKKEWAELGLEVEDIPLPEDVDAILKSPCPFSKKGERVEQTHVLVLKPGSINGEDLNAENFGKFMKSKFPELDEEGYRFILDDAKKLGSHEEARWILMKKDVIDGSRNKSFADQQKMVEEQGQKKYQVPRVLDVIVCAMTEYARSQGKTRLFSDSPWTYTRCQENVQGYQMVVGGFAPAGLCVSNHSTMTTATLALRPCGSSKVIGSWSLGLW